MRRSVDRVSWQTHRARVAGRVNLERVTLRRVRRVERVDENGFDLDQAGAAQTTAAAAPAN